MGCCLSCTTTKPPKSDPNLVHGGAPLPPSLPPPLEEETVKEVLSETPIPKTLVRIANDIDEKVNLQDRVVEEAKVEPTAEIKQSEEIVSEVSEVISEMCSFSESLSAATEKRDDDGEVTQRVRRSPAKVTRRPLVRSPARRSEPSPVKRTYGQGRTMTTAEAARRNVGPSSAGGGSARRSRSPATRGAVGQQRPVRYRSPSMVPAGNPVRRPTAEKAENSSKGEGMNGGVSTESTESLENPLVSLECFIFL
ncbi:Protein like [Actinidia chinensis var. chinensis]|uniref:Protein like n=1 Tax=Actinidia chinensis var. chinensis TaxID=1590841 RepID=A0A2R6QC79_ACTCC|nr:Protein like [Actinidia chinensis var. chinensis]